MRHTIPSYYWTPEPVFSGETVTVLGNGPSLSAEKVCGLDQRFVIAVNSAASLVQDAAVLFSRDSAWCRANQRMISSSWSPLKITTKRDAARDNGMLLVAMERRDDFPPPGHRAIRYGISSGHAAVSLAIAMGAKTIVLLGFDCRLVEGRSHWHDEYAEHRREIYAAFVRGWKGWNAAAKARGVSIYNATPGSAIDEFPFVEMVAAA